VFSGGTVVILKYGPKLAADPIAAIRTNIGLAALATCLALAGTAYGIWILMGRRRRRDLEERNDDGRKR
jgi:hypothetical protein